MLERTIFVLGEIFSTKLNVLMLFVGSFKSCVNNQCFSLEVFFKNPFYFLLYNITCCTRVVNNCNLFGFRENATVDIVEHRATDDDDDDDDDDIFTFLRIILIVLL